MGASQLGSVKPIAPIDRLATIAEFETSKFYRGTNSFWEIRSNDAIKEFREPHLQRPCF
jgi:hypothetical protein